MEKEASRHIADWILTHRPVNQLAPMLKPGVRTFFEHLNEEKKDANHGEFALNMLQRAESKEGSWGIEHHY